MKIPWAIPDLQTIDKQAAIDVINSNWHSMGSVVKQLEHLLSNYLKINYAIATNNGTSALDIALKCIGLQQGDEVIIPSLTYITTGNAVLYNNGIPVFVDIDDTLNIDPSQIEQNINEKTKAIIAVDLGGNPCDYTKLLHISKQHNVPLIVDGAQSLGSEYHKQKCCTQGLINTTSFHAAKILTTIEGGMVFTNNKQLAEQAQSIRNQGEKTKYIHDYLGNNYRMTDIIAAFGINQIKRLNKTIRIRRKKADFYKLNLQGVQYPKTLPNTINCYLFFPILTEKRDRLYTYLQREGIETRITFPIPIYEQKIFKKYKKEICPNAQKISKRILSLPIYNTLTINQQQYIVKKIKHILGT